jgi:hypothetical protein
MLDVQYNDIYKNNSSNRKDDYTPHFENSNQNRNTDLQNSNRLYYSKNSQGIASLNSLSLSDSNSSLHNKNN